MCAHCDYMAGLGKVCSHVGAILFYVEAVRRAKSCTDVPCPWNMPSQVDTIPYAKIVDILTLQHHNQSQYKPKEELI